jgi:spoIIIJ-associated protein
MTEEPKEELERPTGDEEQTEEVEERKEAAGQVLKEMLDLMGYELSVEVLEEEDRILLSIDGEGADSLIGKKGQTLDAIQFLLGRMVNRQVRGKKPVVVDCGGYRQRRSEALEDLAQRLCEKATRTGKIVAVNPMSAHDRRVIHMALKEVQGVTTRSEGDGFSRRLLIVPEPE